jgi:hypothetical protein
MPDVVLDPTTRAPSPAWQAFLRMVGAALVAKLVLWLSGYGVTLDATDQVALVGGWMALTMAIGKAGRDRGWPIIGTLMVLPLVFMLNGCACLGLGNSTPSKAWSVALVSYEQSARTMANYCATPQAEKQVCIAAADATKSVDLVVLSTESKLKAGTVSDAELAAATSTLNALLPLLERAAGVK